MKYLVTASEGPGFAFPEEAMKVLEAIRWSTEGGVTAIGGAVVYRA